MKISVTSGVELVEVNDNGDTIAFKVSDAEFERGIAQLAQWAGTVRSKNDEIQARIKSAEVGDNEYYNALVELVELPEEAVGMIKALFGDDVCVKVFGTETPDIMAITDFISQAASVYAELSRQITKERRESIGKYSRSRGV